MQIRTLHSGIFGPNSEKNCENNPSQLVYIEKMINSSLTVDEIQQFRNVSQRPALLPPDKRYNEYRYDDQWRAENLHALYGSCTAVHFYFTACTSDFPGFLVGIQQEFDTGVSNELDTTKKSINYGYTLPHIQKEHGPDIKLNPSVSVESFFCQEYDFISEFDVLSCASGVLAVRCFTATGQCSKLLFNRSHVNPAHTDRDHHKDFTKLPDFQLDSLPFVPSFMPVPDGKFGALAYFSTFSRSLPPNTSSALNIHNPILHAPIKESIGGIRVYITHPIFKKEIMTSLPSPTSPSSPTASSFPVVDLVVDSTSLPDSSPSTAAKSTPNYYSPSPFTAITTTPAKSTSFQNESTTCCGPSNIVPNDFFPGFFWPLLINIATLIAFGVFGLLLGLPVLMRTNEDDNVCQTENSAAIQIILSWFLCLVHAFLLIIFTFIVTLRQCCSGQGEEGSHTALRVIYDICFAIGIITSDLGIKSIVVILGTCIQSSESITMVVLHAFLIATPVTYLVGTILNRKRDLWFAEIFLVQWVVTALGVVALIIGLIILAGAAATRRHLLN